jgi:hypothetical protein
MGIARPLIPPTAHRAEAASGAIMTALSQSMEFSVRDTCGNFFLIFRGNRSKAFRLHGWNSRAGSVVAGSTLTAAQTRDHVDGVLVMRCPVSLAGRTSP